MKVKSESEVLSRVQLIETPWTAVHQAPLPMGFSRQEYRSGLPLPSPRNLHRRPSFLFPLSKCMLVTHVQLTDVWAVTVYLLENVK